MQKKIDDETSPVIDSPWPSSKHESAAAIVLAGGKSTRMGMDKSMLPFMGKPLIQHVCEQLWPHFRELLIAGGDRQKFAFLNARIVPDDLPDQGPLQGIASALAASICDLNFVIACDIPVIDFDLLKRLLQEAHDCDCVVPITADGHYEPLFAIYRKSALPTMQYALKEGTRRISSVFSRCHIKTVPLPDSNNLKNINTKSDYDRLMQEANCHR